MRHLRRGRGMSGPLSSLCPLRPIRRPSGWGCDWGAPGRAVPVSCCVLPDTVPEREEEEAQGDVWG